MRSQPVATFISRPADGRLSRSVSLSRSGGPRRSFLLANSAPLGRLRGQFGDWQGVPVMPTYHPAYLLRTPSAKAQVWEDLKLVINRLAELVERAFCTPGFCAACLTKGIRDDPLLFRRKELVRSCVLWCWLLGDLASLGGSARGQHRRDRAAH
jgi:hypothetical protein